ncbi:MAG: DUF115 domain-containing protein [Peptococcaceae bacterium]|nr:DUF115 domain-containing protein [Peptococcaceae bacterium]
MLEYNILKGRSDTGEEIYLYCNDSNKKIPLNSVFSPEREAEKLSKKINITGKVVFLIGIGNGALLKYWKNNNNFEFVFLVIIEPFDISPDNETERIIKKSRKILFLNYKDFSASKFSLFLECFEGVDIEVIIHPNYEKTDPKYMEEIVRELNRGISLYKVNKNTYRLFMTDWVIEPLINLKYSYNLTSIEELRNVFKGQRAVLTASGPSLKKQISFVKDFKRSAFIFAAGSSFNGLISGGVVPDFVTSIDSGKANYDVHFKNSSYEGTLIVGSIVNSKILEKHNGDVILAGIGLDDITRRAMPKLHIFPSYPSVALFTLAIIHYLGFQEVYLVGQDLALVNDKYYAEGVHEHKAAEEVKPHLYIESNNGGEVGTTFPLYAFLKSFEEMVRLIHKDDFRIYNLSRNGAKIKGVPYVDVKDIDFQFRRKEQLINLRPKVVTRESLNAVGRIMDEFIDVYLEAKKLKDVLSKINNRNKISDKTTIKVLKALRNLRSIAIMEDVITKRIAFILNGINNTIEYLTMKGSKSRERELLINELEKMIWYILEFIKKLFCDERYIELLGEIKVNNKEKYDLFYKENGIV